MINAEYLKITLNELACHYKRPTLSQIVLKTYLMQLSILNEQEFEKAVRMWIFSGKNFPTPEDILSKAGKSPRKEAEQQWQFICTGKPRNNIAHQTAISMNILGELRTIESLPPKEYAYRERELKNEFIEKYSENFVEALVSKSLNLTIIDPNPPKQEEEPFEPITAEDWARIKNQLKNIGIKLGKEEVR